MLHSVDWYLVADILGQPITSIFKGQAVQEEFFSDSLALEDGTDRSSETLVTTKRHCITSQKSEYLISTTEEA
jgi:hypothetical protein